MQSPSASNSTNTGTKSANKVQINPSKTSSLKTKSTTVLNLNKPNAAQDLETTLEIEKISKKISEHADALYRTWKSHGLAPTEILDLYNVDAGVAAGAIADDKSAEDLHKLVNTFVSKDKEQRGVKSLGNKSKLGVTQKTEVKPKVIEHKINTSGINNKVATPLTNVLNSVTQTYNNRTEPLSSGQMGIKKSTIVAGKQSTSFLDTTDGLNNNNNTTTISTPSSSSSNSSSISSPKVTKLKTSKQISAAGPTSPGSAGMGKSLAAPSKPLDIDIDFNLDLNLNLDVNKLSQQQTENLQRIKELLKETPSPSPSPSPLANSKIPTVLVDSSPVKVNKEVKSKKTITEKSKQNEETPGQKKLAPTTNEPQASKKIGNKLKSSLIETANNKAHDLNQSTAIREEKLNSPLDNNRDGNIINKKRTNSNSSSVPSSSISNSVSSILTNGNLTTALLAKELIPQSTTTNSNNGSITNNNGNDILANNITIKTQKSNGKTIKAPKIKEKSNNKTDQVKDTKTATATATTTATTSSPVIQKNSTSNGESVIAKVADSKTIITAVQQQPIPQQQQQQQKSATIAESDSQKSMETQASSSNSSTTMPTPTKLKTNRPLSNGQEKTLRSPFLTRGSVAERVMIFEKCPDVRNSFLNIKRPDRSDAPPRSLLKVKLHSTPPTPVEHNLIQKELKNTKSVYIPRFYFPHGKPQPTIALERTLRGILSAFDTFPNNQVTKDELPRILKICGLPFYWRMPVMVFCQQHNSGLVERQRFVEFWKQMNVYCHDDASRFVYILSRGQRMRSYILPEDLAPLVQDVVDTHPGLAFLKEATEFHSRYVHTVIARIFYSVNRSWSGKISISELKKSDLLEIITLLEEEDDINQIMAFFSYEHFYVIYCKFWELDKDHDLLISQDDLARHSDHALSTRIVERIFSGCVTRSDNKKNPNDEPKMSYTDFVWFLLSEEDKRTPTAIEYWFRCMDIDGDGLLSMYELEYFYEEQQQRMESIGIESLPFEDCLCQMLDMIKPKRRDAITLGDLKNCKMTHVFFDTFFNLEKYLDHEQRDPFASQRDEYSTDWDRFAAQEYELLITEENE
ncbi:uncharacterized protein ACRADG_006243 isoform 1-T5 [Cochliomyia hominivorax]